MPRTKHFDGQIYDLRTENVSKERATRVASAIRSAGKKARVVKVQRGNYAVYVK